MPRLTVLLLALGLLAFTLTGSGFLLLGDAGPSADSGWEMDPNG
jgi:hypothetical protein